MRIISLVFIWLTLSGFDLNQNQIRIVGSSTLYPFVTIAAEYFAKKHNYTTPIVESIGTGAGMKLFCSGDSLKYPDIVNASRKIKESEINYCHKNKVLNIQEINLGYDGVILAHSVNAKDLNLSPSSLYKALAKYIVENGKIINNPNKF